MKIENKEIESNWKRYAKMDKQNILKEYKTSSDGLSCIEIEEKQEEYGKNIIDIKNNKTLLNRLNEAFINPFNIVLILVAGVTFFTDVIISENKDYLTFILRI